MVWTLRRILIVIVILSSLAVAGTLYWVAATYERFAISSQDESTGSTVSHLVLRQMEDQHRRAVNPFVDEWSRLSTLVEGMKQNDTEKARLAANRMMVTGSCGRACSPSQCRRLLKGDAGCRNGR